MYAHRIPFLIFWTISWALQLFADWCGICGGDNSTCKEERGSYNRTEYGYNAVVRIPAGEKSVILLMNC